jgi:hypothetical protein
MRMNANHCAAFMNKTSYLCHTDTYTPASTNYIQHCLVSIVYICNVPFYTLFLCAVSAQAGAALRSGPDRCGVAEGGISSSSGTSSNSSSSSHLSPAVPVVVVNSGILQHLADMLIQAMTASTSSAAPEPGPLVLDLGGKVFTGTLKGRAPHRLVMCRPNTTLRNGTLQLPPGVQLEISAEGCCLEDVAIEGDSVTTAGAWLWCFGARGNAGAAD